MPSIQFLCSSCQHRLQVDESQKGNQAICPMCNAEVAVPIIEAAVVAMPSSGPQSGSGPQATSSPFQASPTAGTCPPYHQQANASWPAHQQTEPFAIVSLVCSLAGILCWVGSIVGVVFGHIAISKIKASGEQLGGRGLATAGLIIGYVWICIMFVLIVFYLFFIMAIFAGMMGAACDHVKVELREQSEARQEILAIPVESQPLDNDPKLLTPKDDMKESTVENPFEAVDEPVVELPKFNFMKPLEEEPSPANDGESP